MNYASYSAEYYTIKNFNDTKKYIVTDFLTEKEIFSTYDFSECDNYKIDESNYKDFTNYRFVFKKNNEGNYYFDKVEKVK